MSDLDLGAIERRVQERIDIVAEHGGLVPLVESDRLQLLNEVKSLRKRNAKLLSAGPVDRTSWDKVCAELADVKAERDRLRDGIARHRETVKGDPGYIEGTNEGVADEADERLWALLEENHDER